MQGSKKSLWYSALTLALSGILALTFLPEKPYVYEGATPEASSFSQFYANKLAESARLGVRPHNEEKWIKPAADFSGMCFLYLHGYGASRGEGEAVVDSLTKVFNASAYYIRLPGHGTSEDDLNRQNATAILDAVEETYRAFRPECKRFYVVGSSMGGLLALFLSSQHDDITGTIVASPLTGFRESYIPVLAHPAVTPVVRLLIGSRRSPTRTEYEPGHKERWYTNKYTASYSMLFELWRRAATKATYQRIKNPVLLFYYYRDEEHQDKDLSVKSMLEAFSQLGGPGKGHSLNRAEAVENGNHVLLSEYVKSDLQFAKNEIGRFIKTVESYHHDSGANP